VQNFQNQIIALTFLASSGRHSEALQIARELIESAGESHSILNSTGARLLDYGYISSAKNCFKKVLLIDPNNYEAKFNLGNCMHAIGNHLDCLKIQSELLTLYPNNPMLRRNHLLAQEYDPSTTDEERYRGAASWGQWATSLAGYRERPTLRPLNGRVLKIGYVSSDFCQHTVGLFIKDILKAHDRTLVEVYTYYSGSGFDWATKIVQENSIFKNVSKLNDLHLASQIQRDEIDILIDLSGHTKGSRLTAFALRPAPVMISWLGYFATTGLACMDAVLLDAAHITKDTAKHFTEKILQINPCRFYYEPVSWALDQPVLSLPALQNGYITFGSFNNTAKLNQTVFDVWSKILIGVKNSRLILKWRTFIDPEVVAFVKYEFSKRGVEPNNVELQSASFHSDLFKDYDKIDIALDPFPFTGGLTSCEALWMGLPIVTLPQSRVVSRQTNSILRAIGFTETIADSQHDYIKKAIDLAADYSRLNSIRQSLRPMMLSSPLMNLDSFTRGLEDILVDLYKSIESAENR
jgi:protein O-GlcNAc transferase